MTDRLTEQELQVIEEAPTRHLSPLTATYACRIVKELAPRAVAELLELRAIVDRLPVTDDGVHVAPGDKAFLLYATTIGLVIADNVDFEMAYQYCGMDECNPRPAFWLGLYSTLETAQAAKEKSHE